MSWRPERVCRHGDEVRMMYYPPLSLNVIRNDTRCHRFFRIRQGFLLPGDEKCDNKQGGYFREL